MGAPSGSMDPRAREPSVLGGSLASSRFFGGFARHPVLTIGCLSGLALALIFLFVVGSTINQTIEQVQTQSCSPGPCANAGGLQVFVDSVDRDLPLADLTLPAGIHHVRVMVSFKNGSGHEALANAAEFSLQDAAGTEYDVDLSGRTGCEAWAVERLQPNARLNSRPLCFQVGGDPGGKLTLVWRQGDIGGLVPQGIDLTGK
jgi:hypothetical protein